jgi:hypothetical protein
MEDISVKKITKDQEKWLLDNYKVLGVKKCAETLGVSKSYIYHVANRGGAKILERNGRKISDEQIQWLSENYKTIGVKKCAETLGTSTDYIKHLACKNGFKIRKLTTQKQIDFLIENYSKLGGIECSKATGLTAKYIMGFMAKRGVKISSETKSKHASKKCIIATQKRSQKRLDLSQTIKIETAQQAYTMGFLWGDGYLRPHKNTNNCYLTLDIVQEDYEHIKNTILSVGNWHVYSKKPKNRKPQASCILLDGIWGVFAEHNDYSSKSLVSPQKILSHIPNKLKHYWWRGYTDADGCFYINRSTSTHHFSICGTYEQDWSEVESLLNLIEVRHLVIKRMQKESKHSIVRVVGIKDITKLGEYLYQGDTSIGLPRKLNKYLQIRSRNSDLYLRENPVSYQ